MAKMWSVLSQIAPFHPEKHIYFPFSWQMCNFAFHLHPIFKMEETNKGKN
jgi:hypothetical protein